MPYQAWGVASEATSIYLGSGAFFSINHQKIVKIENLLNDWEKWVKVPNFVIFRPFQHAISQKKALFTWNSISKRNGMICLKKNGKNQTFLFFG